MYNTTMTKRDLIYKYVAQIPAGKVVTYGAVAKQVQTSPRVVGNALHSNPNPQKIPCHRIVNSRGQVAQHFAFGGADGQSQKLLSEGVRVNNGRVDLTKYLFTFTN